MAPFDVTDMLSSDTGQAGFETTRANLKQGKRLFPIRDGKPYWRGNPTRRYWGPNLLRQITWGIGGAVPSNLV